MKNSFPAMINKEMPKMIRTNFSPFFNETFTAIKVPNIIPTDSATAANQFILPVQINIMTAGIVNIITIKTLTPQRF